MTTYKSKDPNFAGVKGLSLTTREDPSGKTVFFFLGQWVRVDTQKFLARYKEISSEQN